MCGKALQWTLFGNCVIAFVFTICLRVFFPEIKGTFDLTREKMKLGGKSRQTAENKLTFDFFFKVEKLILRGKLVKTLKINKLLVFY